MNNWGRRWINALHWAQKIKASFDTGKYILMHESEIYTSDVWKIEINEEDKFIVLTNSNTRCTIYEYDLDWDHGSYDSLASTNERLSKYKLYRME